MKTHIVIFVSFLFFASVTLPAKLMAQLEESEVISLTARINEPIEINIDNTPVVFEFNSLNDYQKGLGATGTNYSTNAKITASSKLTMKVIPLKPMVHEDGFSILPLENLGFSTNIEKESSSVTHPLNESNLTNIEGNSRSKDLSIRWEMGTKNLASQNLQKQSLKPGIYTTEVMILFAEEI